MKQADVETVVGLVGRSVDRVDAEEKVRGRAKYTRDLKLPNMLHGATVRSPHPHALIERIDTSPARRVPGVREVITAADVPGLNLHGVCRPDQPALAADKVRFVGDPVAAVAAETEEAAREAAGLVRVSYRPLEAVFDPFEALRPDAPKVHEGGNVCSESSFVVGDVEDAFKRCDVIVERTYRTQAVDAMYLEAESTIAYLDEQGNVVLWSPSNYVFRHRPQLARILGMGLHRVRIATTAVGGSFGARSDITGQAHAAILAMKTGRPVRIQYDPEEGLVARSKRHPSVMYYRSGARRDGALLAVEARIVEDTGAYASWAEHILGCSVAYAMGPYRAEAVRIHGVAVYTNNPISGALRGFGSTQPNLGHESQMDLLAGELGLDPVEFRLHNIMTPGTPAVDDGMAEASGGLGDCITRAAKAAGWKEKRKLYSGWSDGPRRRGIGISAMVKGFGQPGGASEQAASALELLEDGSAILRVGSSDTGQGSNTVLAQIVAHELGIPMSAITVIFGDTFTTPDTNASGASKQTFLGGNSVLDAASRLRNAVLDAGVELLGVSREELELVDGSVRQRSNPANSVPTAVAVRAAKGKGVNMLAHGFATAPETVDPGTGERQGKHLYVFGAQIAEVEVDTETGQVTVLRLVAAHDVGKAINPRIVEGQIQGCVQMGLGSALTEEVVVRDGVILSGDLATYLVPTAADAPEITPIIVETAEPDGPYGAKAAGEPPIAPTAAAVVNALAQATGRRVYSLPARPEHLRKPEG